MSKWWIVPTIMIVTIILGLIGAAWSMRPIIEYTMLGYPENFDSKNEPLIGVDLSIKNTGKSYAKVNLVLIVESANISLSNLELGMTCNGTQLKIVYDLSNDMNTNTEKHVNIQPTNNPRNFTIDLKIENEANWDIPNGVICHFLEPHGYVTHLMYDRTDSTVYKLVTNP
jgi:hypothetical protein